MDNHDLFLRNEDLFSKCFWKKTEEVKKKSWFFDAFLLVILSWEHHVWKTSWKLVNWEVQQNFTLKKHEKAISKYAKPARTNTKFIILFPFQINCT